MSAAANYYVRRIYTHMRRCAKEMYKCLAVCFVCLSLALMMLMMIPDSDSYCYCESPNPNPNPACCLFVTLTRSILNGDVTARTHTCTAYIYMPPMYWCIFTQLRWRQAYTHTHTHTRARTPAHSLTRTTTVDVIRDFRWSRETVVGGPICCYFVCCLSQFCSKTAICSLIRRIKQRLVGVLIVATSICMLFSFYFRFLLLP